MYKGKKKGEFSSNSQRQDTQKQTKRNTGLACKIRNEVEKASNAWAKTRTPSTAPKRRDKEKCKCVVLIFKDR
jgi:hypothetical protein